MLQMIKKIYVCYNGQHVPSSIDGENKITKEETNKQVTIMIQFKIKRRFYLLTYVISLWHKNKRIFVILYQL